MSSVHSFGRATFAAWGWSIVACAAAVAAPVPEQTKVPVGMLGTWEAYETVIDGTPANITTKFEIRADGTFTLWTDGQYTGKGKVRFDNQTGKTYDFWFTDYPGAPDAENQPETVLYKIEKDVLTECQGAEGDPVPDDFTSDEGSGRYLAKHRRVKEK